MLASAADLDKPAVRALMAVECGGHAAAPSLWRTGTHACPRGGKDRHECLSSTESAALKDFFTASEDYEVIEKLAALGRL
jgi:hypothetical protein